MYKYMVGGLLCAIAGAILTLPVAFSQIPTREHEATFMMPLSTGMSVFGIMVGVLCCHSCKGINLLVAGILLFLSTVFGVVAMIIYSIYDIGNYFPVVCGLGWFAVLMTSFAAVLYFCAFARRKNTSPR